MTEITARHRRLVGISVDDTSQDDKLSDFLIQAENKVAKARYPYGCNEAKRIEALDRYSDNVDDIYVYLYNKQGAEGESAHSENGIARTYESAGIPNSYLYGITPMVSSL